MTLPSSPCQSDLQGQEELLYRERKEREQVLSSYRTKTEKHKAPAEKAEAKVANRESTVADGPPPRAF